MKNLNYGIILLFLLAFMNFSCQSEPEELSEEEKKVISEQEKIAFDDIMFGISKSEYDLLNKNHVFIGDNQLMLTPMYDHKGRLYRLLLSSEKKGFDAITKDLFLVYFDLLNAIKVKYGKPKSINTYPSQVAFRVNGFYDCDLWTIGKKEIKLRLVESNSQYQIWCDIKNQELNDAYLLDKEEKEKKETENAASKF